MSLVTSETIYRSVEICLLMLIARGWRFVHMNLSSRHLTSLSIMMGLVYLSYCSMFVTYDIEEAKQTTMIWVTIVHVVIAWDIYRHSSDAEKIISDELICQEIEFIPNRDQRGTNQIRDSLKLKLHLMKWFRRATLFKIIFAMGIQGLQPLIIEDSTNLDDYDVTFDISEMVVELLYAFVVYYIFSPRVWPDYFFSIHVSSESRLNEVLLAQGSIEQRRLMFGE